MKKYLAIVLALAMVLALAACGGTDAPAATEEPAPVEETAAVEEPSVEEVDVTGTYTFVEISDMGASLWTLTLNADGTFAVEQDNPFGDKTVGEGEYTAEGTIVHCGEIDASDFHGAAEGDNYADRLMGEFVGENNAIDWEVNPAEGTAVPVDYDGEIGTLDDLKGGAPMGDMPEGLDFTVAGTYTYTEVSDMGESLWTLELHPDMTYSIEQDNPFGDKTVGESEYTYEGNIVYCGGIDASAFHGAAEGDKFADRLMGEFVGEDNSTVWVINPADGTMEPAE